MSHPLSPLMKRFFSHYLPVQRGLSINTILAYRDAIKLLLCWIADTLKRPVDELVAEDLTEPLVLAFLDHLEQERGCSPKTRNARLAAIRTLLAFIGREEPLFILQCQQIRSIPLKRTGHKKVAYLEEKEMQGMFEAVDINSRTAIRDKALLLLLYNTGARVSEAAELKLDDVRLDEAAQIRLLGKGNKERRCPLWPETVAALQAYLKQRGAGQPATQHLLLNANGLPITRFGIRHIIHKYGVRAQGQQPSITNKNVNPHTIRHTTAMHLLRSGNDVNMVSYWLGHANINTTHIYLEIDMEMKRKMIDKARAPKLSNKTTWRKPHVLQWLNALGNSSLCTVNYSDAPRNERKRAAENRNST